LRTISEQRLNWRRDKGKELSVKGYTQRRIADKMKISLALVNDDYSIYDYALSFVRFYIAV
jgi:hypothetical protein